jgi:flagellin-like protein
MRFSERARARPGVSEVVGSLLTIAVTLIAGAVTWGYANSQAAVSENSLQNSFLSTNNYLNEQFKVIDITFASTTQVTFWVYNVGSIPLQLFQVRLYDSAGLVNILYNYTKSGTTKTDYVYDLKSTLPGRCGLKVSTGPYESPLLTSFFVTPVKSTNAATISLTIPSGQGSCSSDPSYGQTFTSGTTYTVVVTGYYGNVFKYSQTK